MRTGSGEVPAPDVNTEVTKSSNESTNTSSAEARIAGYSAGSVTSRSAPSSVAPRSIAASSTSRLSSERRARTITVTYEMENVMWPRMTVCVESSILTWPKSSSRPTAVTISGVINGSSMRMLEELPMRPRARTSPNASSVPRTVATTIVTAAIWKLRDERVLDLRVVPERAVPAEAQTVEHLERVGRVEREDDDDRGSGTNRYRHMATYRPHRKRGRSKPRRRRRGRRVGRGAHIAPSRDARAAERR